MGKLGLYVGCCNRKTPYFATANGHGIAIFSFDTDSGQLTAQELQTGIDNPTFVTVSPDRQCLYANSEVFEWNEGTVTAYAIDQTNASLKYINKQTAQGNITAFLSFDKLAEHLLVANYAMMPTTAQPNQSVTVMPINKEGGLAPVCSSAQHCGKSVHVERQERSHAHSIRITPDGKEAVAADLGTDTLVCYAFDSASGRLSRTHSVDLPSGSGPRHLLFDSKRERLYVSNELNSTVSMFAYRGGLDSLEYFDSVVTVPDGQKENHCSEIMLAPNGDIYVANRGHDSVSTLSVSDDLRHFHLTRTTPTQGRTPRHMAIAPGGRFLVVANQDSDRLEVFAIDVSGGTLTHVGGADTGTPTCLAFGGWMP